VNGGEGGQVKGEGGRGNGAVASLAYRAG